MIPYLFDSSFIRIFLLASLTTLRSLKRLFTQLNFSEIMLAKKNLSLVLWGLKTNPA